MAEAHSFATIGKEFRRGGKVALTDEGLRVSFDVVVPPPRILRLMALRRLQRLKNYFLNQLFPFGPLSLVALITVLTTTVCLVEEDHWLRNGRLANFWWWLMHLLPWAPMNRFMKLAVVTAWAGVILFLLLIWVQRLLLRAFLAWRGWMYVPRGKPTKIMQIKLLIWSTGLKVLMGRKPMTYSFQSSMPSLPLQSLSETCRRYLKSMRPVMEDAEYALLEEKAKKFLSSEGPQLQMYLRLKWLFSKCYVTDWWLKYCYLRGRSPIAINSNYYCMDSEYDFKANQAGRAANLLHLIMQYKELLDSERLAPLVPTVPLCMEQYKLTFSTTRLPGKEMDILKHWHYSDSRHIVVVCKGRWYCFDMETPQRKLTAVEIQSQLEWILKHAASSPPVEDGSDRLAALTGGDRTHWANVREEFLSRGKNRLSLDAVERAIMVLSLDEDKPSDWTSQARNLFHGNGSNRWFDKSVNMVVFANGKAGFNGEHSWADAPVTGHMWEYAQITGEAKHSPGYDAKGNVNPNPSDPQPEKLPTPTVLKWEMSDGLRAAIAVSYNTLHELIDNLELRVLRAPYGAGFIKTTAKMSPDGYVQMALQLAYFRENGKLCQTYESAMTRFYGNGRTETIRSACAGASAWVRGMEDPTLDKVAKVKLLRAATEEHTMLAKDAMSGKGVDRHLFALYCVSVGKGVESEFLQQALRTPWKLSTSQQSQQQTDRHSVKNKDDWKYISPGGGFGPVADDGYGVSYMVMPDDRVYFHVSAKRSSPVTNADKFAERILKSLDDIRQLCEDDKAK